MYIIFLTSFIVTGCVVRNILLGSQKETNENYIKTKILHYLYITLYRHRIINCVLYAAPQLLEYDGYSPTVRAQGTKKVALARTRFPNR
jgi:hypothetical protein